MAKTDWTLNDTVLPADLNQIGEAINTKETPAGAQDKATIAEANAKAYTDALIDQVTADGIPKLNTYPYVLTAVQDQDVFPIPLQTFDADTDTLLVSVNTVLLTPDKYTVTDAVYVDDVLDEAGFITLAEPRNAGDVVYILVMKNVPVGEEGAINGRVLAVNSVPQDRVMGLGDALDGKLNLAGGKMIGRIDFTETQYQFATEIVKVAERVFLNGIANEKFDIEMPNGVHEGTYEVIVTSMWGHGNAAGSIKKSIYIVAAGNGVINHQETLYTETSSRTGDVYAISDVLWDATKQKYVIKIVKRGSTTGTTVTVKLIARPAAQGRVAARNITFSEVYTTDPTSYPAAIADKTIYQSGSNANGSYVRYGDGTQICYRTISDITGLSVAVNQTYAMPNQAYAAQFLQHPITFVTGYPTDAGGNRTGLPIISYGNLAAWESPHIRNVSDRTITRIISIGLYAIGRWK